MIPEESMTPAALHAALVNTVCKSFSWFLRYFTNPQAIFLTPCIYLAIYKYYDIYEYHDILGSKNSFVITIKPPLDSPLAISAFHSFIIRYNLAFMWMDSKGYFQEGQ